jgi:hypothetical protein
MAAEAPRPDDSIPPPGEAVHLPGPSYLPVITAFGISLALCGIVLNWAITAIGGLIALIAIVRWVRETRADIAELPLEH